MAATRNKALLSPSLWGIFFSDTIAAAATGLFIFVYPVYITELGGTGIQVGIVFSVSLVVSALAYIPGAILIQKYDRKIIMMVSLLTAPVAMLILYMASSWIHVLIAEAIWFLGNFGAPAFIAYITELSPKESVMRSFGVIYAGPALAYVVAPIAGAGIIYSQDSLKPLFLLAFMLRLAAPVALLLIDPQKPKEHVRRSPASINQLFNIRRADLERIVFLVLIAAILGIGVPYLPLYLADVLEYSSTAVLLFGSIGYLGAAVLGIGLAELGSRKGGTIAVQATISVFVAGAAILVGVDAWAATLLSVFMLGVMTSVITIMDSIVGITTPEEKRGWHLSLYLMVESIVMAPMPFIGGLLYDGLGERWPFMIASLIAIIMFAVTMAKRELTKIGEKAST